MRHVLGLYCALFAVKPVLPPDPAPTGWYLHGLARELVRRGHSAKVISSRRSYDGSNSYPARENLDELRSFDCPPRVWPARVCRENGRLHFIYVSLAIALLLERTTPDLILH